MGWTELVYLYLYRTLEIKTNVLRTQKKASWKKKKALCSNKTKPRGIYFSFFFFFFLQKYLRSSIEQTDVIKKKKKKKLDETVFLCWGSLPTWTLQWGAAETTELKGSPFKAWSRSVYSHTCYAYCQGVLPCLFKPFRSIHLHFS